MIKMKKLRKLIKNFLMFYMSISNDYVPIYIDNELKTYGRR